jgi:hypothetical protein
VVGTEYFGTDVRFIRQLEANMKNRAASVYWAFTALLSAFILLGAIADVRRIPEAVSFMRHLGYPAYLLPFLGTAKILGVLVVALPSPRTLKEWAYAGLVIDLTGALYSHLSVGDPASVWTFPAIGLVLVGASYAAAYYRSSTELADGRLRSR